MSQVGTTKLLDVSKDFRKLPEAKKQYVLGYMAGYQEKAEERAARRKQRRQRKPA